MLTQRILARAISTPNKIAVIFDRREISYAEFVRSIERCRRMLLAQGVSGDGYALLPINAPLSAWIIGLALRSLGLTTAVMPSLEAAADIGLPAVRCVATIATEHWPGLQQLCDDRGWRVISLPDPAKTEHLGDASSEMPNWPAICGGRILLTSGTTGRYKKSLFDPIGERAEHHRRTVYGISDQTLVNLPYFGAWSALGYNVPADVWDAGGTVLLSHGTSPWESFQWPGITLTLLTPHLLAAILKAPDAELTKNDAMRLIVTAGALSQDQYEAAKARLTSQIYVSVGSTEAGAYTFTRVEQPDDLRWHRVVPECGVQVIDDDGQPMPAGQVGQIRVRVTDGETGYLFDEPTSREFFRGDYFYPGDLGVFRSDGRLALQGRESDVVNVLGQKISPAPLEERLVEECAIGGACFLSDLEGDAAGKVYVVLQTPKRVPQADLLAVLNKFLPSPFEAKIVYVEALPRNHMGKVQRDVVRRQVETARNRGVI